MSTVKSTATGPVDLKYKLRAHPRSRRETKEGSNLKGTVREDIKVLKGNMASKKKNVVEVITVKAKVEKASRANSAVGLAKITTNGDKVLQNAKNLLTQSRKSKEAIYKEDLATKNRVEGPLSKIKSTIIKNTVLKKRTLLKEKVSKKKLMTGIEIVPKSCPVGGEAQGNQQKKKTGNDVWSRSKVQAPANLVGQPLTLRRGTKRIVREEVELARQDFKRVRKNGMQEVLEQTPRKPKARKKVKETRKKVQEDGLSAL